MIIPSFPELLRDAFGEEKFCYVLVAELKDPPSKDPPTVPNGIIELQSSHNH